MATSPFRTEPGQRRSRLSEHFAVAVRPLLEQQAYADLHVEDMLQAAGVSRTTFYAYFGDKTDLLLAMVAAAVGPLERLTDWPLPNEGGKEVLRAELRRLVTGYREHRLLLRALVEGAGYDVRVRQAYDQVLETAVASVAAHVGRGQQAGTVAPFLAPLGTARLLVHMGERSLYRTVGVATDVEADFLDLLTELIWRTLYEGYR